MGFAFLMTCLKAELPSPPSRPVAASLITYGADGCGTFLRPHQLPFRRVPERAFTRHNIASHEVAFGKEAPLGIDASILDPSAE